jgi:hypothetical protein
LNTYGARKEPEGTTHTFIDGDLDYINHEQSGRFDSRCLQHRVRGYSGVDGVYLLEVIKRVFAYGDAIALAPDQISMIESLI